ncbi:MAG: NAD(P)/FAD-dependent oxidoreductase [Thermosipho sp. (in: Bacteria)]|nr:NAD(P)/FAD-dependent oxidoreductase [Thermosipho sp. (in: thermotogales)]
MKIAIIGFGAAGIGFLKNASDLDITVFEASKDVYSSSISGIRADGKLFVSSEMGGDLEEILYNIELQKEIVDFYSEYSNTVPETGKEEINIELKRAFHRSGFRLIEAKFYHIGTDKLKVFLENIYEEFVKRGIKFVFGARVVDLEILDKSIKIKYLKDNNEYVEFFDKVYVAVGRSGLKLIDLVSKKYPEILLQNNTVDLGIRFELPDFVVQELNEKLYEFKIKYQASNGLLVRTFCNNPSGFVVTEKYPNFVTVNGHSFHTKKSSNTNFAILVTHTFTEPFNDPNGYGEYIVRLANILAGGRKVILQTYGDFKKGKRTKKLWNVFPTLNSNEYILGDLNLVLPHKTVKAITEFLEQLENVIPGITNSSHLMYGIEVKFYSKKMNNNFSENLKFIGDCSGFTRSIVHATAHGIIEYLKLKKG